jgi:hypothetical protein
MSGGDGIADWLQSVQGRIARIVAGSLLIILGLGIIGGFLGVLLLILGAVPIASAAYGTLLIGPLLGRDIHGRRPEDQPRDEDEEDGGGEDDDGEAREDESGQEPGGERRGEEPAEEPQEQLEKDTSGEASATRDESSDSGRRESTGKSEDSGGDKESSSGGSTGAPPLARAERPPGQGPRTKDVSGSGGDAGQD